MDIYISIWIILYLLDIQHKANMLADKFLKRGIEHLDLSIFTQCCPRETENTNRGKASCLKRNGALERNRSQFWIPVPSIPRVLSVVYWCCNRWPQIQWFKTNKHILLKRTEGQKSQIKVLLGLYPCWKLPGKIGFLAFSSSYRLPCLAFWLVAPSCISKRIPATSASDTPLSFL